LEYVLRKKFEKKNKKNKKNHGVNVECVFFRKKIVIFPILKNQKNKFINTKRKRDPTTPI